VKPISKGATYHKARAPLLKFCHDRCGHCFQRARVVFIPTWACNPVDNVQRPKAARQRRDQGCSSIKADAGPLAERQVGGDDDSGVFVKSADEVEHS
jgi:hypothetical protein